LQSSTHDLVWRFSSGGLRTPNAFLHAAIEIFFIYGFPEVRNVCANGLELAESLPRGWLDVTKTVASERNMNFAFGGGLCCCQEK